MEESIFKSLTGKLAGGLSSLKKLKNVLPQSKLCDIYRALFESHTLRKRSMGSAIVNRTTNTAMFAK